jgi:phosphoribosyl 1,2-cyclic phosphodiesterase
MKVTVLASGSSGNATFVEAGDTRILVDAGIGPKVLARKLAQTGAGGPPQAIVVTHGHGDHVGECARIGKALKIPVYASESTARTAYLGDRSRVKVFGARSPFVIGDITISPLPIPHDAAQVALVFSYDGRSAGLVTDLGEVPPRLPEHLAPCDVLLIESNHDPEMLESGPYPQFLKRRVASSRGHLSNFQTHALLRKLSPRTHTVVLMHLSRTNNRADIALEIARDAIGSRPVKLTAALQDDARVFDTNDDAHHAKTRTPRRSGAQLAFDFSAPRESYAGTPASP